MTDPHHPGQPSQSGPQNQAPWWNEPQQPETGYGTALSPSGYQQPQPGYQQPPQPAPARRPKNPRGRGPKIVGAIVYSLVVLLIGIAIGSASKSGTPAAASTQAPATTYNSGDNTTGPASNPNPADTGSSAPAAPASHVLIRFAGSGIKNSAPFNVGSGPVTVTYRFNCASFGTSGNFAADLLYGNQSSLNSDDLQMANDLATSGGQTTTVYPQDPGQDYYLSVNSECTWHMKVVSG
jgi:hypothetical protein